MLIVTHEMPFAREVADRIVFMDAGQVVEQGTSNDLFKNPKSDWLKTFLSAIL